MKKLIKSQCNKHDNPLTVDHCHGCDMNKKDHLSLINLCDASSSVTHLCKDTDASMHNP